MCTVSHIWLCLVWQVSCIFFRNRSGSTEANCCDYLSFTQGLHIHGRWLMHSISDFSNFYVVNLWFPHFMCWCYCFVIWFLCIVHNAKITCILHICPFCGFWLCTTGIIIIVVSNVLWQEIKWNNVITLFSLVIFSFVF